MLSGREHGDVDDEPLLEDDGDSEGAIDAEDGNDGDGRYRLDQARHALASGRRSRHYRTGLRRNQASSRRAHVRP